MGITERSITGPIDVAFAEGAVSTPDDLEVLIKLRSMIANGCTVRGRVENSVLSPGVYVSPEAIVRSSIVMNDTWIGPGAVLDRVIVDKEVVIGARTRLGDGDDNTANRAQPDRINTGLSVVGKGAHIPDEYEIGRNVVVAPWSPEAAFKDYAGSVASGSTVG